MRRSLCLMLIIALSLGPAVQAVRAMAPGDCAGANAPAAASAAHADGHAGGAGERHDTADPSNTCHCGCGCSSTNGCAGSGAAVPLRNFADPAPVSEAAPDAESPHAASHDSIPPLRPPIATSR